MSECSDIVQLEGVTRAFAGIKAVDGKHSGVPSCRYYCDLA